MSDRILKNHGKFVLSIILCVASFSDQFSMVAVPAVEAGDFLRGVFGVDFGRGPRGLVFQRGC